MRNGLVVFLLMWFSTSACNRQAERKVIKEYYDIDSLFLSQPPLLRDLSFIKSANIDDKTESSTVKFDTTGWKKELSMFLAMDINKAALVGAYEKSETATELGKNVSYNLKSGEEGGIKWIQLEQDSSGNVYLFKALFQEDNALYQNRRELTARFEVAEDQSVLSSYKVDGYQKIIMKDTVNYTIEARLVAKDF